MPRSILKPRSRIVSTLTMCGIVLTISSAVSFAEVDHGPAEIILKTAKAKKPAPFPHAKHQDTLQCGECHHGKDEDGVQKPYVEGQEILRCVVCHNKKDMTNAKLNNFKNSSHANCKSCHKAMKKEGKATGPTKCTGCHIKKIQ